MRSAINVGANNSVSDDATASVSGRDAHRCRYASTANRTPGST